MRLWHYELLPYLPELQFKGQLRELVAIMHDWRDKGKTNHLLVNRVMEYPKSELKLYFEVYADEYCRRYKSHLNKRYYKELQEFSYGSKTSFPIGYDGLFDGWHNKEYLRMNMSNLAEKHFYGVGKSRITDEEWRRLVDGYRQITGEEYVI